MSARKRDVGAQLDELRQRFAAVHGEARAKEAYRRGVLVALVRLSEAALQRELHARGELERALEWYEQTKAEAEDITIMLAAVATDMPPPAQRPVRVVTHGWCETPTVLEFKREEGRDDGDSEGNI